MDDRGIDRLFTLPLGDFVAARNQLAKSIKAQGDKETAARILKLPKPSISAWAINQLVRREPELLRALLSALDRQRELQVSGLGAGVDRNAMKDAKQSENEAMGRIERALPAILEAGGHASGRPSIERCVKSIRAAAIHPEGRPLLENGHLTIDFDALGFDALGAIEQETAPQLRLVTSSVEDKRREKEERLDEMRRQRIEAQEKMQEEQKRFEEARRRAVEEKKMDEEEKRKKQAASDLERVKKTMFGAPNEPSDLERVKKTMFEPQAEPDPERVKQTVSDATKGEPERTKQKARLGEATKVLGSLRVEHARLEEQAIQLADQVERARAALERAERDAARAKEDVAQKAAQIAQLEQLLGLFEDAEDDA